LTIENNGVAGIVTTLVAGNDISLLTQKIRDLSFTFIAPLTTNYYCS